jgi:regulatory protein
MTGQPERQPVNAKASSPSGFGLSLKGRALRYLAAREHSRMELERKLKPHAESAEQLAQVLDDLAAKDFISEARVVESVINRRSAKFGAARVKHELLGKGLDAELVLEAMNGLKATEVERAREIWRRKFDGPASDAAGRAKQMRFLAARGFSGDTIRKVVSSVEED